MSSNFDWNLSVKGSFSCFFRVQFFTQWSVAKQRSDYIHSLPQPWNARVIKLKTKSEPLLVLHLDKQVLKKEKRKMAKLIQINATKRAQAGDFCC